MTLAVGDAADDDADIQHDQGQSRSFLHGLPGADGCMLTVSCWVTSAETWLLV